MQDISENGADVAHLTTVHKSGALAGSAIDYANKWLGKVLTHNWKVLTERNLRKRRDGSESLCACLCGRWLGIRCLSERVILRRPRENVGVRQHK